MTPAKFLATIVPQAQQSQRDTGISAAAIIAQAALESSWGRSGLTAKANNLFGIKASAAWTGATVGMPTKEFTGGQWVTVPAKWRAYPDWHASINDHARFLFTNPRYRPALAVRSEPEPFCVQLQSCGYATDPNYADLLISIIHGRKLDQYDVPPEQIALLPWAVVPA